MNSHPSRPAPRALRTTLALAFSALATLTSGVAVAVPVLTPLTVDFEDLNIPGFSVQPSGGYQGFDWGNGIHVLCREAPAAPCGDNQYAATSGANTSRLISRTDDSAFYFDGGDFWSRRGADAVGDFYFILYSGNTVVYQGNNKDLTPSGDRERMLLSATPSARSTGYSGPITAMSFIFDNDDYDHFAFDNLRFRVLAEPAGTGSTPGTTPGTAVPAPASAPLIALGLGLLAWRRRSA